MEIGVYLAPRTPQEANDPGHMCVWWEKDGTRHFRGFYFAQSELPKKYQSPKRWRDYLFAHCVPGYIRNDIIMRDLVEEHPDRVMCRAWPTTEKEVGKLQLSAAPGPYANYSFNPDDHPNAFKCVTWAVTNVNKVLGPVLPKVRQGRIKLMTNELRKQASASEP